MTSGETFTLILALIVAALFLLAGGKSFGEYEQRERWKPMIAEHGCAAYDPATGEWDWINAPERN